MGDFVMDLMDKALQQDSMFGRLYTTFVIIVGILFTIMQFTVQPNE